MDLKGKTVAVIGIGKTGLATARFLAGQGARIRLTDGKPQSAWGEALASIEALSLSADLALTPYGPEVLIGADWVIPSPGVYPANPILSEAIRRGIPVISELELAWRFLRTPLVAITGTNGKTTVRRSSERSSARPAKRCSSAATSAPP
jgi:UDP-N-acetylmuramoylalanine--D-glutamate ligase